MIFLHGSRGFGQGHQAKGSKVALKLRVIDAWGCCCHTSKPNIMVSSSVCSDRPPDNSDEYARHMHTPVWLESTQLFPGHLCKISIALARVVMQR